ncbi:MAG: trimethylamine methyltransferase family protein [Mogibacterium sp.]|nr:trimethylamine methyltransferase family protein [Mogibacterium sp.]
MAYIPQLKVLSDAQVAKLHEKGVEILQRFGMQVEDPEIRTMLVDAGNRCEGDRIYFDPDFIQKVIENNQHPILLKSPKGSAVELAMGKTLTHSTGGAPWMVDGVTGKRRNALSQDLVDCIKLMNQLPNLDLPCALVYPDDVAPNITQFVQTAMMLEHSSKPIDGPGISTAINGKYIAELFKLYGHTEDNPIGMAHISPESPLMLPKEITDTMRHIVGAGIPVSALSAPMGGLTAPLTVLGTVAQCHAEILAFAAVAYLINPKTAIIYASRCFFANMKTGESILGLPETGYSSAIAAQLANYLGWTSDFYGFAGTSCALDQQTGYEKMMNGMLPALAGATLITGYGSIGSVMCASLSQLVLDDEMAGMVKRVMRPNSAFDFDKFDEEEIDEYLGFDAIECVVDEGEIFLEQEHTVEYLYKDEIYVPKVGFDSLFAEYIKRGEPSITAVAEEKAKSLLAKDDVAPIDAALKAEVEQLIAAAEREM